MRIGYTTGTFDFLHPAHVAFLNACRTWLAPGDKLIVGVVTDELAERQKRKPLMSYLHRKALVENLKSVDLVVAHHGDDKQTAEDKLNFDVLFIGEEYFGSDEYRNHQTVYIPNPLQRTYSTSQLLDQLVLRHLQSVRVFRDFTTSRVWSMENAVVKELKVAKRELGNTGNAFGLPVPPPRHWRLHPITHEPDVSTAAQCLPGVNASRELAMNRKLKDQPFVQVLSVKRLHTNEHVKDHDALLRAKQSYAELWAIVQPKFPYTLTAFLESKTIDDDTKVAVTQLAFRYVETLRGLGVVHGDLHGENIVVRPSQPQAVGKPSTEWEVAFIDWGWSMCAGFDMSTKEREFYEHCLATGFDRKHLEASLH